MDKLQIKILENSFTIITDEEPERLTLVAENVEKRFKELRANMRGRTETEVMSLVAFDISGGADKQISQLTSEIEDLKQRLEETEINNKKLLIENMNSAESELVQIAVVKEQENNELRAKLREYESHIDMQIHEKSSEKNDETEKLRLTLENFEKSFNEHAKQKEKEIQALQAEAEDLRAQNNELKERLAAFGDDGQLKIC